MTYAVIFSGAARRDMQSIAPRIAPAIIEFVYGDLAAAPRKLGKPLQCDLEGAFSARRGRYRILYDIDDEALTIQILRVAHRSDVYRPN